MTYVQRDNAYTRIDKMIDNVHIVYYLTERVSVWCVSRILWTFYVIVAIRIIQERVGRIEAIIFIPFDWT